MIPADEPAIKRSRGPKLQLPSLSVLIQDFNCKVKKIYIKYNHKIWKFLPSKMLKPKRKDKFPVKLMISREIDE